MLEPTEDNFLALELAHGREPDLVTIAEFIGIPAMLPITPGMMNQTMHDEQTHEIAQELWEWWRAYRESRGVMPTSANLVKRG